MCGIVGYVGSKEAQPILIDCLKRLEYRGYDSAGLAVVGDEVDVYKAQGEISTLEAEMPRMAGTVGIAHTRWATQGRPTTENAHPFQGCENTLAVVHNGIISNFMDLRRSLIEDGHKFSSETDTEVFAHLVEAEIGDGDMLEAVRRALKRVVGTYAFAVVARDRHEVVAARNESPLVIGVGNGENFLASDVTALLKYTNRVIYIMDGETVRITSDTVTIVDSDGAEITRAPERITWSLEDAEKGGYPHFMLKEIFEQPSAIHDSLLGRIDAVEGD